MASMDLKTDNEFHKEAKVYKGIQWGYLCRWMHLLWTSQYNNKITLILTEPERQTQHDTEKLDNYITYHASWYRVLHKTRCKSQMVQVYQSMTSLRSLWCYKITWAPGKAEKGHSHCYGLFPIACCFDFVLLTSHTQSQCSPIPCVT